ncbi:MAG TPA: tetratricopeptide repeat protein [Caulobacteraceae bacterium]|nr:tetratricopeptide repeat protein [Caulobacteraceae bacterium]
MTGSGADFLGNPVSATDRAALAAIDDFVAGFLGYESRAANVVRAAAAHPDQGLLCAYAGALFMLMESPQGPQRARPWLARAEAAALNRREARFAAFLAAWIGGDIPAAQATGEAMIADWPRDLVVVKLCQYLAFNRGDAGALLRIALGALPANRDQPHAHAMAAFGYEQSHLLRQAEAAGRCALEMRRKEPWAQHALAHVMLTEGRIDEGARFLEDAAETWDGLNSFMVTHAWWHLALFYLSQGREAAVLAAYDRHCWAGDKDYSQDQVGAVSLLARAELAGIDVGARWDEVAERIAARGVDVEQPFLALQYLYGLVRAGRAEAPALLHAVRRRAASARDFDRAVWAEVAAPAAEGVAAWLAGEHPRAIAELGAALPRMAEVGGSHAQRDLFDQIHLAALVADGRWSDARKILERRRADDPDGAPVNRQLARVYAALGLPIEAAEARERAAAAAARRAA